jgi:hypothetical protein
MAKHTAGPWYTKTKERDAQGLIYSESTGANIAVSYDPRNANLIAAAPDMLAALELIADVWDQHGIETDQHETEVRAAIAKAKGKE